MKRVGAELPVSAYATGVSMEALGNSLTLEHMLDPTMITESDVRHIEGNFFDSLTSPPKKKAAK